MRDKSCNHTSRLPLTFFFLLFLSAEGALVVPPVRASSEHHLIYPLFFGQVAWQPQTARVRRAPIHHCPDRLNLGARRASKGGCLATHARSCVCGARA